MHNLDKCSVCGIHIEATGRGAFTCDECGTSICDRCYGQIHATYVEEPTKQNIVGFVKFCPTCQKKFNNSTTKQYVD